MPTSVDALIGPLASPDTPELRAVAVNTLFGAFARRGTSASLGNRTDSALLAGLREWADVILVGAGTVHAEDYGPAATPMAVVSRSLEVDTSLGIFEGARALILAPELSLADASLLPRTRTLTAAGAELHATGGGEPEEIVATLRSLGFNRILCEGGPSLYAAMLGAGLVDVLHLTVDPSVGPEDGPFGLELDADCTRRFALENATVDEDSMLFCRYRRAPDGR
ncbi:dihydrofolate reductase family protein [Corynebacterium bouchesdurhonense]|uniref:dihydrofolate reductase family protein n=1 Tax=Corynebacterium bouchesdurhonense TaxID=1720192 RepID=UPI00082D5FD2|nr:dihydrofolate reductase family protein [Corynebacterium bouchesdurhonense]